MFVGRTPRLLGPTSPACAICLRTSTSASTQRSSSGRFAKIFPSWIARSLTCAPRVEADPQCSQPGQPEDIARTIDRLRDQHPLRAGPIAVGLPLCQSDVMTRREIRSNPVCQLGRLVGIQYAMDLWIAD